MIARAQRWWHAEEESAVAIYQGSVSRFLLAGCTGIVLLAGLGLSFRPGIRREFLEFCVPGFTLIVIGSLIGARRRGMIFKAHSIAYRPMLAEPRAVAFREILGLRRVKIFRNPVPGLAIDLPGGLVEVWPLEFDAYIEIVDRLSAAAGKPVTGEWSRW
jgi:hypothetical protein